MNRKGKVNSDTIEKIAEAQLKTIERQEREREKFLAGDGIVIRRYNKEATKERLKYLRKNRRQLEKARPKSIATRKKQAIKRAKDEAKAKQQEFNKAETARRKKLLEKQKQRKPHFAVTPEEKRKAIRQWANNKARYIILRYSDRQAGEHTIQEDATVQKSQSDPKST